MEINEENCKSFRNGRKVSCGLLPYNFISRNKTNKQTKWSTDLNRFMWEKLLNQKKKKNKWINNNNYNNNNKNEKKKNCQKSKRLKNW